MKRAQKQQRRKPQPPKASRKTMKPLRSQPLFVKPLPRKLSPLPRVNARGSQSVLLSECSQKYAVALTDPWAPEAAGACIPTTPAQPSHKARAQIRFDGYIGLQGFGFVAIMHTGANDSPFAYYSEATFNATNIPAFAVLSGMTPVYMAGLPYTYTQLNSAVNIFPRIVASGVKFEYTGTTLNEMGLTYSLHEPAHETLLNSTVAALGAYPQTVVQRVSHRATVSLNGYPVSPNETTFSEPTAVQSGPYPWCKGVNSGVFPANGTFGGGGAGTPITVVAINGVAGQTFHVELCQLMEYVGFSTTAMQTKTHADPHGYATVIQAVQQIPYALAQEPDCPPICQLKSTLFEIGKTLIPRALDFMVGPAASRALQAAGTAVSKFL